MKLTIDRNRCEGHGQCAAVAAELLSLDDNAEPVLPVAGEVPAHLEKDARAAVSCCPVAALSVDGE